MSTSTSISSTLPSNGSQAAVTKNTIDKHEPSKYKTLGFALVIIVGIGGLAVAGVGTAGLLQAGALSNLGELHSIVMIVIGGGGGIPVLLIGIMGFVNTNSTDQQDLEALNAQRAQKKAAKQEAKAKLIEEQNRAVETRRLEQLREAQRRAETERLAEEARQQEIARAQEEEAKKLQADQNFHLNDSQFWL